MNIKIGSKVIIKQIVKKIHYNYPWYPKCCGRIGVVNYIQTVDGDPELIYHVKFDPPLLVGVVPEGEHQYLYIPSVFMSKDVFGFTRDQFNLAGE